MDRIILTTILTTTLSIIIGLLVFIAKKLDETIKEFKAEIKMNSERHNVSDILFSHLVHESVNSRAIAEGKSPWPKIFSKKKEREH